MFVIRGTSKVVEIRHRLVTTAEQAITIQLGWTQLKKGLETTESKSFKNQLRAGEHSCFKSDSWLICVSQRGTLRWSPEPEGCWLDAQQGMSEHGSQQQDIRVV